MIYEIARADGSWGRGSRAWALTVAGARLVRGHGRFTILAPFREPTSHQAPSLPRRSALDAIGHLYGEMRSNDVMSVRDGLHDVILRVRTTPAIDPRRIEMVANARFGVAHAAQIHYSQDRPIDMHFRDIPWTADCSGSTIAYAKAAGAPDPSGNGFSGQGNTDSILAHLRHRSRIADAELGDPILWHRGSDGIHVAVVVKPGRDPLLASHGSENGPLSIRYSVEYRYHAGETATALNLLS